MLISSLLSRGRAWVLPLILHPFIGIAASASPFANNCQSFEPETLVTNATRAELSYVSSGTNLTFPDNDASCNRASQVVRANLCRIALHINTTSRSSIVLEMWMPEEWNGRLVTVGGGGIDGCVHYEDLAYASAHGFAVVGTNNGHNGTSGIQFLDNEDVVVDFSWRALHVGVVAGKALASAFNGSAQGQQTKSYYLGCSLGGRQGIQAASMFPDDFDGIVAGAPAVDFNNLYSWRAGFFPITGSVNSSDFITATTWKTTIHEAVLSACDDIDGVIDGIIEDPTLCKFEPSVLVDSNGTSNDANSSTSSSLTTAQAEIVRQIISPTTWPNGTFFFPGFQPGNEILAAAGLYDGQPYSPSVGWFRYAVYNDPSWDPATYTLDKDGAFADAKNSGNVRSNPTELFGFQRRGGKLLLHHGQQDQQITSFHTPIFYDRIANGMGGLDYEQMDEFLRFFRISGMFHCNAGPGAWVIGQGGGAAPLDGVAFDGQHNVLATIVDWVEKGIAPETITGTKFVNDTLALGVDFERNHCRWPYRNTYLGQGKDPKKAESWECKIMA
jgi:feruloyl esterase